MTIWQAIVYHAVVASVVVGAAHPDPYWAGLLHGQALILGAPLALEWLVAALGFLLRPFDFVCERRRVGVAVRFGRVSVGWFVGPASPFRFRPAYYAFTWRKGEVKHFRTCCGFFVARVVPA